MRTDGNYRFDNFQLDLPKRRLLRDGETVPLKPKAFDLLAVLVENNGKLLSKEDIFRLVWDEQIVEESNLTVSMSAIRRALGEQAKNPRYITTVSGRGYYFNADLQESSGEDLVIESHSVARITVEEAEEVKSKKLKVKSSERKFSYFYLLPFAFLLAIGGFFWLNRQNAKIVKPAQMNFKRLTTNGKAIKSALSPNGKMFVFSQEEADRKTSLWLGHADGSKTLQILQPIPQAVNYFVFAPNGNQIYYTLYESNSDQQGSLYRLPAFGGVPEKIKEKVAGQIAFAPDGKQFAFMILDGANQKSSLMIADADGKNERELASRPLNLKFSSVSLAWSPDGKSLAVNSFAANNPEIFIVSATDGAIKQLTNFGWFSILELAWKKDSDGLAVIAIEKDADLERQIWEVSYPSGEVRKLVSDLNFYNSIDISTETGEILATQGQYFSNIWVAPADNLSAAKQVTFDMLGKQTGWNGLAWTADGRIVYAGAVGASETLWEMNADGTNQKQLVLEGRLNNYPNLPDDGKFIVFASNRSGGEEIWRVNADGANLTQLTTGGNNSKPNVSPDGKFIIYNSLQNGLYALRRISVEGGENILLTEKSCAFAAFSPDGKTIACDYNPYGQRSLAIISSDGGEPQKLFDVPLTANFRLGIHWTPDGQAITYRDWKNGIWKQNLNEKEPQRLEGLPTEKLYSFGWSHDGKSFAFTRGTVIRDVVLISNFRADLR